MSGVCVLKLQEFVRLEIHVVIAEHLSSDTLGPNLRLDAIEHRGVFMLQADRKAELVFPV
jgi:hypothetical protein